MGRFEGKVVIITGASSGIGAAAAVDFTKEGAKVVITGRNAERLNATAKKCKEAGGEVLEIIADLVKFENLELIIKKTVDKFGGIDILVNNAGVGSTAPVEHLKLEDYEKLFQGNLRAPVFLSQYALPYLKKTKGCILNISSIAGIKPMPSNVAYSMTKAAMDHFTKGLAAECVQSGVRVNSINPGVVATAFADNLPISQDQLAQLVDQLQPFGSITSEQISEQILHLAASTMITGIVLPVNAGFMI